MTHFNSPSKQVAILGMGCRFPEAATPEQFWQVLCQGKSAIATISQQRCEKGGYGPIVQERLEKPEFFNGAFLEGVDQFDAAFFGLTDDEANQMDPQQRILLEVTWEALENSGLVPDYLVNQTATVFIGATNFDYSRLLYRNLANLNIHSISCTSTSILANRISYVLGLHGASATVDTACASSLVALHQACTALLNHESHLGIVGGVNLTLDPVHTLSLARSGLLSATGQCRVFDAEADGYVRGEGCGVVILKRLEDALRDGDPIQAVIQGSAINHNGISNGLTAPNGPAQQRVIRQALHQADVLLSQLDYVEVSAVGSQLGDAIEVGSLKAIFQQEQETDRALSTQHPICWLSSAKPNIGNLEAASGMVGLIKVVLALQHEQIPPQIHLQTLNPYIKLTETPFRIAETIESWKRSDRPRLAGISSFGFGGTNAHVIISEPPDFRRAEPLHSPNCPERSHHILTLSAKTAPALTDLVERYRTHLESNASQTLADICFTTNVGRSHFSHRLAIVAESKSALQQQLETVSRGQHQGLNGSDPTQGIVAQVVTRKRPPKVVFACGPLESPTVPVNTGQDLYWSQPEFRTAIDECDRLLHHHWQISLLSFLYPSNASHPEIENSDLSNSVVISLLTHFSVQYALARLWQAWGIHPVAILSQGNGRILSACLAGVIELETALQLIVWGVESFPDEWMTLVEFKLAACPLFDMDQGAIATEALMKTSYWLSPNASSSNSLTTLNLLEQQKYGVILSLSNDFCCPNSMKLEGDNALAWLPSISSRQITWCSVLTTLAKLYGQGVPIRWQDLAAPYVRQKVMVPTYPWQHQPHWFDHAPSYTSTTFWRDIGQGGSSDPDSTDERRVPKPIPLDFGAAAEALVASVNHSASPSLQHLAPSHQASQQQGDRLIHWLRDYAASQINSRLIDERRCIPPYVVLDFGNQGVLGMQVPQEYGGLNLSHVDTFRVFEQLGAIDVTLGAFVGVHHVLGTRPILRWAHPHLRDELLPGIAQGRELAAFAITEPGAGSNPRAIATMATATGSGTWQINGQKIWIGSGSWASVTNVFVQTIDEHQRPQGITGFVMRRGTRGFRQGPEALTMGMRGMVQNSIHFDQAPVTSDGLLGGIGAGLAVAQDAMMFGRLGLGVLSLGGIKRCTQLMLRYGSRRSVSTGRLLDNPVTLTRLGELTASATAVEALVYTVAQLLDNGFTVPEELYSASKISGPEFYWQATDQLVQLLGGRGYIESNLAPQMMRDARLLRIFEGPTETLTLFMGSRVIQAGENLYQFLRETLGMEAIAQRLQDAIQQASDRIYHRNPFGVNHANTRWLHRCVGELTTWAILLATVQAQWTASHHAPPNHPWTGKHAQRLQRAITWTALHFEQKLQQMLLGCPAERVVLGAGAIAAEIEDYSTTIGLVEQTLAGEDHELDEWLQLSTQAQASGQYHASGVGNGGEDGAGNSMVLDSAIPITNPPPSISTLSHEQKAVAPHNKATQVQLKELSSGRGARVESQDAIADWIEQWLRQQPSIEANAIDTKIAFADYGMDSVLAIELVQDLEDWLSLPLDATLLWNFSNIETLAQYLAKEIQAISPSNPVESLVLAASSPLSIPTQQQQITPITAEQSRDGNLNSNYSPQSPPELSASGATTELENSITEELMQLEALLGRY